MGEEKSKGREDVSVVLPGEALGTGQVPNHLQKALIPVGTDPGGIAVRLLHAKHTGFFLLLTWIQHMLALRILDCTESVVKFE